MGILRSIAERIRPMPKAKNKAEAEAARDIQQNPKERLKRGSLESRYKRNLFTKAFNRVGGSNSVIRKRKAIYTLPGGIAYRLRKSPTGRGGRFVGRPRQSFKARVNPFTGQLVRMPALPYYKLVRRYNQIIKGRATGSIQMQQAQLARRGVPPSIAAQILVQRQAQAINQVQQPQMQMQEEMQERMPMPQQMQGSMGMQGQMIPRERFVVNRDRFMQRRPIVPGSDKGLVMQDGHLFKIETDLLSGKKRLIPANRMLY